MRDWIVGYRKAAKNAGQAVGEVDMQQYEEDQGEGIPDELRDLYLEMNGAELNEGVTLFSVREGTRTLERRPTGAWLFGAKGDSQELIAARGPALVEEAGDAPIPDWVRGVEDETWLFVAKDPEKNTLRVYRSLEQMLATMIPPQEVEEFGDTTYARALNAVQGALSTLTEEEESGESTDTGSTKIPLKGASKPEAKASAKKASGKKPPSTKQAGAGKKVARAAPKKKGAAGKKAAKAAPKKKAAAGKKKPAKKASSAQKRKR